MMKVVAFGPKLAKKNVKEYSTTKPHCELEDEVRIGYARAMIQNRIVMTANPKSWSGLRPILSTSATVTQYPGTAGPPPQASPSFVNQTSPST